VSAVTNAARPGVSPVRIASSMGASAPFAWQSGQTRPVPANVLPQDWQTGVWEARGKARRIYLSAPPAPTAVFAAGRASERPSGQAGRMQRRREQHAVQEPGALGHRVEGLAGNGADLLPGEIPDRQSGGPVESARIVAAETA